MNQRIFWMLALTAAVIPAAFAQQYVYPAKGQSPQQQKSDEAAPPLVGSKAIGVRSGEASAAASCSSARLRPAPVVAAATAERWAASISPGKFARGATTRK